MAKKQKLIGSIISKLRALKNRRFGILSLADIWKYFKKSFHLIIRFDWLKVLQAIKLIIEIVRSILSYYKPKISINTWDKNIFCSIKNKPFFLLELIW